MPSYSCIGASTLSAPSTKSFEPPWVRRSLGPLSGSMSMFQLWSPSWRQSNSADRKSTRLNSSHSSISYAVFCLKKKKKYNHTQIKQDILHNSPIIDIQYLYRCALNSD